MATQNAAKDLPGVAITADVASLTEAVQQALEAIQAAMFEVVDSEITVLRDASRHILEAGGKRIRPRLALLSFAAAGGVDMTPVIPVAAAIELMHTASVVHDDINDHGVVRRGRPSVNAIWGRTFALLTGDYLFAKVYELMAPYKDLNMILAEASVALVEGETLQAAAVKENRLSREVYYDIISRKTAALFRAPARLGAELAGGTRAHVNALAEFGYRIGLAFQIVDDILDLTGTTETIGKSAGLDLAQGKGFAAVTSADEVTSDDPMETIKERVLKGTAVEEARVMARSLVASAIAELDVLPDSPAKDALIELANQVIDREF